MCSFGSHRLVELFSTSKRFIPWLYWLSPTLHEWAPVPVRQCWWKTLNPGQPRQKNTLSFFFICENEILYLLFRWMGGSWWRLISPVSKITLGASVGCWRKTCTIRSAFSSVAMIVFNFVHLRAQKNVFPALTFTVILCLLLNIWKVCRS